VATAHGKVLIEAVKLLGGVTLRDGVEELDVVEDVVVVSEVVGGMMSTPASFWIFQWARRSLLPSARRSVCEIFPPQ